jgi:hypothetical protein
MGSRVRDGRLAVMRKPMEMQMQKRIAVCCLFSALLAACGSDEGPNDTADTTDTVDDGSGGDVTDDTSPDTGDDVNADAEPDAEPDADEDTGSDAEADADACADGDDDGVCDADDLCIAGDDNLDADDDGVPDACDCTDVVCEGYKVCTESVDGAGCNCATGWTEAEDGTCAQQACVAGFGGDELEAQVFGTQMVGCPAVVAWTEAADVCGAGWSVCGPAEYGDLVGEQVPATHYWTNQRLFYDGDFGDEGDTCTADLASGFECGGPSPMRVCAPGTTAGETSVDSLGNECNWWGCGLNGIDDVATTTFGGCDGNETAGVLCCAGGVDECGTGADDCGDDELCVDRADGFDCVDIDDTRYGAEEGACSNVDGQIVCTCPYGMPWDAEYSVCTTPCADGTAVEIGDSGVFGCAGSITFENRDGLCGEATIACTSAQYAAAFDASGGFTPTDHYWLDDNLGYLGDGPSDCDVGLVDEVNSYFACSADRPMRVCAPGEGTSDSIDSYGNTCTWWGCTLNGSETNYHLGGCDNDPTAGTLCCLGSRPEL